VKFMASLAENENDNQYNLKGYLVFWSGQQVSLLGSSIIQFVIIWWITVRTQSALFLAYANLAGFLPLIIITPVAGVFVDRWKRKNLIGTVDFLQALVTVGLILIFIFEFDIFQFSNHAINLSIYNRLLGNTNPATMLVNTGPFELVWVVLAVSAIRGVFQAFQGPAIQAITPLMVPRKHLNRFNSVNYLTNSVIFLIGPVVAALLYAIPNVGIEDLLWIDAATFAFAVVPLVLVKIPEIAKVVEKKVKESKFWNDFKEGIVFIKNKKGLLALLSVFTGANLFLTPLFTLMTLYVDVTLQGGVTDVAFTMAFFQAGMIISSVIMIFWKGFDKKVIGVVLGIFVTYIGFLMISLTPTKWFWFMGIGLLIQGLMLPMLNLSSQYIWQTVVPSDKLGRVMSVRQTLAQFSAPLGMILAGVIAESANAIRPVFWGSIVGGFIVLGISWFFTNMRQVQDTDDFKTPDLQEKILPEADVEPVPIPSQTEN
jgi:DHA3 family macrolide efflux protein-like MFS transporter